MPDLTPTPTPVPPPPPQVVEIAGVNEPGRGLAAVLVVFSEAMDPVSVLAPDLYQLLAAVTADGMVGVSRALGIASISYESDTNTAAIVLESPFRGPVQVTVEGVIQAATGAANTVLVTTVVR